MEWFWGRPFTVFICVVKLIPRISTKHKNPSMSTCTSITGTSSRVLMVTGTRNIQLMMDLTFQFDVLFSAPNIVQRYVHHLFFVLFVIFQLKNFFFFLQWQYKCNLSFSIGIHFFSLNLKIVN